MTARVTAAVFAAYAFAWGMAAFSARLGVMAGIVPAEAVTASGLLALFALPVAVLWAFAVPSVATGWLALGGGGAALTGLAWVLGTGGA